MPIKKKPVDPLKKKRKPETKKYIPGSSGRPTIYLDPEKGLIFGAFRATFETMASLIGCSEKTISREWEKNGEFCQAYKKGLSETRMKLSEAQIKCAIEDRNPTLLIWLGKVHLQQTEKTEETKDIKIVITNNFDEAPKE